MASNMPMGSSFLHNRKAVVPCEDRLNSRFTAPCPTKITVKDQETHGFTKNSHGRRSITTVSFACSMSFLRWTPPGALSSLASADDYGQNVLEDNQHCLDKSSMSMSETQFDRVHCLVSLLYESARSFSLAIRTLQIAGTGAPVSMAWNGVDVHAWHKHIAYQVPVYALLSAAVEVELFLSHNRCSNPSSVHQILTEKICFLGEQIESQLNKRNPTLVEWFRKVKLPQMTAIFMSLFKKWSMDYAGSGVAGAIVAITCCAAVGKLGSGRISCSLFSNSIEEALFELITTTHTVVSLDKLHHLATEAGFEKDFLSHFGFRILPCKSIENLEFWIGLVQTKLFAAFQRERVTEGKHILSGKANEFEIYTTLSRMRADFKDDQENSLPTLGLFAYLGRESRLFLSRHNVKDIDEPIQNLLNYLESGILFIYPVFSTLSEYELFMEVTVDEIGWLNFYASYNCQFYQENKRSKQQPTQAEQEIILYTVLTICYDVISGFAHYTSSIQQTLGDGLLEFLLQSQSQLSTCLEDYWAAYDITGDLQKIGERNGPDFMHSKLMKGVKNSSLNMDVRQRSSELQKREKNESLQVEGNRSSFNQAETSLDSGDMRASKSIQKVFLKKSISKLVKASVDIWMGTQLLFVDICCSMRFLVKIIRGHKVTMWEKRKIQRTMTDLATLIPITIFMLIPISAVGHAALLKAIKRYLPFLIPSPYSDERINTVKQLQRTKKMLVSQEDGNSETIQED